MKNARGHTPLDLATNKDTRALIERAFQTVQCKGKNCGNSKFDFKNIRFYCESCTGFFCAKCSDRDWVYEEKSSENKWSPVCRCKTCGEKLKKAEQDLQEAMETRDFVTLHRVLSGVISAQLDIDVKLRHQADVLHLKLEKELDIKNFIASVAHVDNYKTILKSVKVLNEKQANAEKLGVTLDESIVEAIN